jgi:LuxR family transcriptional regulator
MMDFPQIWVNIYSHDGLMVSDPTVIWGFRGEGHIRWSDIEDSASCVLSRAAKHGMAFGVTFSTKIGNSHSIASFARHDRELTDSEVRDLQELFIRIHTDTHAGANLKDDVRKMFEDYKLDESITSCI